MERDELLEKVARAASAHYGFDWDELPDVNPVANGELDQRHFIESAEAIIPIVGEACAGLAGAYFGQDMPGAWRNAGETIAAAIRQTYGSKP